ncbi:MAG: DUF4390 domain-containing protein [Candidatus Magnetoovum sp. WYHC-5]|nr:DUF4390 domain-containing protein [Candidatus Magnetoovum sp. WYHC-5]
MMYKRIVKNVLAYLKVLVFITLLYFPLVSSASAAEIEGPILSFKDSILEVSFSLALDANQIQLIKMGIEKEYIFYVDLFRKWGIWPDEFIAGYKIIRRIKVNPVKGQFMVISDTEKVVLEKRFMSFDSMIDWALTVRGMRFSMKRLPADGRYFIRVKVESIKQKPPEMLGYFFFFMAQNELNLKVDSLTFYPEK